MDPIELKPFAADASALLKVMGNEHRLMVLCYLFEGERSVGQLEALIGLSQSALSQHLARLRRDRLVKTRRDRQTIYYSLASAEAVSLLHALSDCFLKQRGRPGRRGSAGALSA